MKFLYKIYSGYDGFTPKRIPERMLPRHRLALGWAKYIDVLEVGHEVWVYFHGPRVAVPGVYVRGVVSAIEPEQERVLLRVREYQVDRPLTDPELSARIGQAVGARGRQVFVAPEDLHEPEPVCGPDSCSARHCDRCPRWKRIPIIAPDEYRKPGRLTGVEAYVPAIWVIPSRCFAYVDRRPIGRGVDAGSRMFYAFKSGEKRYAYPLARAIHLALGRRVDMVFDAIVPVPLSPEKAKAGEVHRTLELSRELSRLVGTPIVEALGMSEPFSKRRLRNAGWTVSSVEWKYSQVLLVSPAWRGGRVLLVDDVCDHGSTLRLCARALKRAAPETSIVAVAAGQMIVREAVADVEALAA